MSYRELRAWQIAMDLVEDVYRITRALPADERFGLTAQLRRAAVSVPSNIAEGQGRRSSPAFANHVNIARGSVLEVETQLRIAVRLQFVAANEAQTLLDRCDDLSRMLRGLADSLVDTPAARRSAPDAASDAPDARRPTPDEV